MGSTVREKRRDLKARIAQANKGLTACGDELSDLDDDLEIAIKAWVGRNGSSSAHGGAVALVITRDLEGLICTLEQLGYV